MKYLPTALLCRSRLYMIVLFVLYSNFVFTFHPTLFYLKQIVGPKIIVWIQPFIHQSERKKEKLFEQRPCCDVVLGFVYGIDKKLIHNIVSNVFRFSKDNLDISDHLNNSQ